MSETRVLNPAALESLRELGGDEFLGQLVETFLAEAPTQLASLESALERGDAVEACRAAHTLKSNAATFGAEGLAELCRTLEERAREEELDGMGELAAQARAEYARVEDELRSAVR